MKSERQQPDHYLRQGEGETIRAQGGPRSPTRKGPQPPKAGAYSPRSNPPNTAFRRFYERGDLPIAVEHRGMKNVISWKVTLYLHACESTMVMLHCGIMREVGRLLLWAANT